MSATEDFNQILKNRAASETHGEVATASQWADWTMNILARPTLNELAVATGAAELLAYAWDKLREQWTDDFNSDQDSAAWRADVYPWIAPLDRLLATGSPPGSDADVAVRLRAFAAAAIQILDDQQASAGALVSARLPARDLVEYARDNWPDISLLWSQAKPLIPFFSAMGRQTGPEAWSEWFAKKRDAVVKALPAVLQAGGWLVLGKAISSLLGVGLLPVLGTNVITFGSSLLTPWKALLDFPALMKKQAVLYRLHEYGLEKLQLPRTNPVMQAIQHAISAADWTAVKVAFQVTPAAVLITVYSGVKLLVVTAKPSAGYYYDDARALVNAADTVRNGKTRENKLALMALLHLAGSYETFVAIMTERLESAYKDVSSALDI
jgi:hypothetical protein